ncbi:MAG: hypothetical protein AAGN64_03755 [Bacteroidota bacterium]
MTAAWVERFDPPWLSVDGEHARALERELCREVHPDHPLCERCAAARAFAQRTDCDDVAFALDEGFAIVHLTWKGRAEQGVWPGTSLFETLEAMQAQMALDHEDWTRDA